MSKYIHDGQPRSLGDLYNIIEHVLDHLSCNS